MGLHIPWTDAELRYVWDNREQIDRKTLAATINRTPSSIRQKLNYLRLKAKTKRGELTEDEVEFIRENYRVMSCGDIARHLNRLYYAIEYRLGKIKAEAASVGKEKLESTVDYEPDDNALPEPVDCLPGSPDKVKALADRVERNQLLWNPNDKKGCFWRPHNEGNTGRALRRMD